MPTYLANSHLSVSLMLMLLAFHLVSDGPEHAIAIADHVDKVKSVVVEFGVELVDVCAVYPMVLDSFLANGLLFEFTGHR
jgi:hypothetical protein